MQYLIMMQGHSGSGKSTLAKIIAYILDAEIFSTDDLFVVNGVYKFDATKLGLYHKENLRKASDAMYAGKNVVIDNTNIQRWQAKPYVEVAVNNGVNVKFVRAMGDFQNVHGVPNDKVAQMKRNLEELTVESVMASKCPF